MQQCFGYSTLHFTKLPIILSEICSGQDRRNTEQIMKGAYFVIINNWIMLHLLCIFSHSPFPVYKVPCSFQKYFQIYAPDKRNTEQIMRGAVFVLRSVKVTIFSSCTFSFLPLIVVWSFIGSYWYSQRYARYDQNTIKS